ncbi:hypothetical protein [Nocardia puris]|uniref:DUF8176 domain-containing protein n=1 Tax=Nocardia puris TaxID=208602 RepID=A0A366D8T1_9NOCA|nr:hypothetical protein [Nocardia puris]RBO86461.1 hypothetical protein DFR74_1133 [Nocardia puris]
MTSRTKLHLVAGALGLLICVLWPAPVLAAPVPSGRDQPPIHNPAACPNTTTDRTVTGNGPGSTADGPAAILGFHHAYYTQRSGTAARAFTTPDADLPAAETIQRGIDHTPATHAYCVHITPAATPAEQPGGQRWAVSITVADDLRTLNQHITTRTEHDHTLITTIEAA